MPLWSRLLDLAALSRGTERPAPATAAFRCAVCGGVAATVTVVPPGRSHPAAEAVSDAHARVVVAGFVGTLTEVVERGGHRARQAVEAGDAEALWATHALWAPFYCPTCRASYCDRHWTTEVAYADDFPGWYEHTVGTCPNGHARIVDD